LAIGYFNAFAFPESAPGLDPVSGFKIQARISAGTTRIPSIINKVSLRLAADSPTDAAVRVEYKEISLLPIRSGFVVFSYTPRIPAMPRNLISPQ
jgi:hypothetical protein